MPSPRTAGCTTWCTARRCSDSPRCPAAGTPTRRRRPVTTPVTTAPEPRPDAKRCPTPRRSRLGGEAGARRGTPEACSARSRHQLEGTTVGAAQDAEVPPVQGEQPACGPAAPSNCNSHTTTRSTSATTRGAMIDMVRRIWVARGRATPRRQAGLLTLRSKWSVRGRDASVVTNVVTSQP